MANDCFPRTVCPECGMPCTTTHGYHTHWAQKHWRRDKARPAAQQRALTAHALLQVCDAHGRHLARAEAERRDMAREATARPQPEPHWQTAVDALHAEIGRLEGIIIRQQREQAEAQRAIAALDAEVRVQRTRAENALADVTIWQRRMATWRPVPHLGTYLNRTKESA